MFSVTYLSSVEYQYSIEAISATISGGESEDIRDSSSAFEGAGVVA